MRENRTGRFRFMASAVYFAGAFSLSISEKLWYNNLTNL